MLLLFFLVPIVDVIVVAVVLEVVCLIIDIEMTRVIGFSEVCL